MFRQYTLDSAAIMSAMIAFAGLSAGVLLHYLHCQYCDKHQNDAEEKHRFRANIIKFLTLTAFAVMGLFLGNIITIGTSFCVAKSHGMAVDPETNEYNLSYGEVLSLNRYSVKETNIDVNDLKNKAIIYVRYDCPDCVILHSQLAEIKDMIFLSSRSEKGRAVRELYNINLTEIPQGVYIDNEGNATTISITQGAGDSLSLDLQQIAILREMVKS